MGQQAWRAEHGQCPDSLDSLVPGTLDTVPLDPFSSAALQYRRDGERYVLYSVGPDGKDDGGRAVQTVDDKGEASCFVNWGCDGDYVWGVSRP